MNARRTISWLSAFGLGFVTTFIATAALDASDAPPSGQYFGELHIDEYCRSEYGAQAYATLLTDSPDSWKCLTFNRGAMDLAPIDFDQACGVLYDAPATADLSDADDRWRCYRR